MGPLIRAFDRFLKPGGEPPAPSRETLSSVFGPLELSVLEALWKRPAAVNVKTVQEDFPAVAYTTLMTTLDRLYKKAMLVRTKQGRAFFYAARFSREELQSRLAADVFESLIGGSTGTRPLLSSFVEAVGERDEMLLDELEVLLEQRRLKNGRRSARAKRAPEQAT